MHALPTFMNPLVEYVNYQTIAEKEDRVSHLATLRKRKQRERMTEEKRKSERDSIFPVVLLRNIAKINGSI